MTYVENDAGWRNRYFPIRLFYCPAFLGTVSLGTVMLRAMAMEQGRILWRIVPGKDSGRKTA